MTLQNLETSISPRIIEFNQDFHPEFEGYISERDGGVWISAIKSKQIGQGNFSKLVAELKAKYQWIRIPTPSQMMIDRAEHLGFALKDEWFGEPFDEMGTVLLWEESPEVPK